MRYEHLNIVEREKILFCIASKFSITETAKYIGTVSRELKRNCKFYSPSEAQKNYQKRRKKLENPQLFELVKKHYVERRGKIQISNPLSARPKEANDRQRLGDFEADMVAGENGKACLLTLTDRKSRFLICRKLDKKNSECVRNAMIESSTSATNICKLKFLI